MSERYNRPRTPPGPPPSSSSRKPSARGPTSSATSSKSLSSKSYDDRMFEKYDKSYKSSSYQSSKQYPDDKYKSGKMSEKVTSSKYVSKSVYIDDSFKVGSDSSYSSSQRYNENKDSYSSKYSDKGRYSTDSKYPVTTAAAAAATSQYSNKKYDDYDTYQDKASRYPKQESSGSYYGSSYNAYSSYDGYGGDRQRGSAYSSDRISAGTSGYGGDKFGGGARSSLGGGYAGDKVSSSSLGYGSDKQSRGGNSSYGGEKHNRGGGGYGGDKHGASTMSYGDSKSASSRSRLYTEEDRRVYSNYSPARTARSPVRGYSGSYDDYGYTTSSRASEKQYLDRYVIGDSVVYGPPGQYPRNLQPTSPGRRPPSPPSPPLLSRSFNRYSTTSPKRYSSGRRSLTPTASGYLSPSTRRPPSPPLRRPPSPDSLYMRGRDRSYDTTRSKERFSGGKGRTSRSPLHDRGVTDRRDNNRNRIDDRSNRRDNDRRVGSREKPNALDSNKRGRIGDQQRNSNYRNTSDTRSWAKDSYSSSTQGHKDNRNPHTSPSRNTRRDSRTDSGSRDRGRRLEDRLGINPASSTRRSPAPRARVGRNATSPRDNNNKKPRRPDDLRLWIESRKNEGGKKGISQSRARPLGKGPPRSGDRSKIIKRPRLGDPKRRLGGKARRTGGPMRRNKILNKYRRLTAKRGMRSGGGGSGGGGGRYSNRSNREGGGGGSSSKGEGADGDRHGTEDVENSKPGSTASIRRVIKKPKRVSQVNNLEIKPRIMGKTVKKLLKDPKEEDDGKSRYDDDQQPSYSSREEGSRDDDKSSSRRDDDDGGAGIDGRDSR